MGPCSPQGFSKSNQAVYGSLLGQIMLRDRTLIYLSLEQSQEHKGDKKQDEKQPERRPGAGGSLKSTPLMLLLAHFSQMIGDYLQRGGHNSAFLLSLSPCKTTPLLYFLGLFHLKQTSQAPLIDIPEANTMRQ